jgi:hypothetical protein
VPAISDGVFGENFENSVLKQDTIFKQDSFYEKKENRPGMLKKY